METMKAAYMLKDSPSLSIRRAVLVTLYSSFESWLNMKSRQRACSTSPCATYSHGKRGVLDTLSDITRSGSMGEITITEEYSLIAAIVDWSLASCKLDPDENCRVLKSELIRVGIAGFGLLEEQND